MIFQLLCEALPYTSMALLHHVWRQVVTEPTPWQGGLVAISSFGFGGSNVHALVAGVVRPKGPPPLTLPIPSAMKEGESLVEEVSEADDPLRLMPSQVLDAVRASLSALLIYQSRDQLGSHA